METKDERSDALVACLESSVRAVTNSWTSTTALDAPTFWAWSNRRCRSRHELVPQRLNLGIIDLDTKLCLRQPFDSCDTLRLETTVESLLSFSPSPVEQVAKRLIGLRFDDYYDWACVALSDDKHVDIRWLAAKIIEPDQCFRFCAPLIENVYVGVRLKDGLDLAWNRRTVR